MTDKTPTVTVLASGPATDRTIADVEASDSGWSLKITYEGQTFGATLTGPTEQDGSHPAMELHRWPSVPRVLESVSGYLRGRGLSHVASALRASVEAELKP